MIQLSAIYLLFVLRLKDGKEEREVEVDEEADRET